MKTLKTAIVSAILLLSISSANASIEAIQYTLKGDAVTGSRIKQVEAISSVPFNKAYDELSAKQQGLVNAKFNNLGLNDIPPFPSKGLKSVYKPVISANKKFAHNQSIRVLVDVTSTGSVDKVVVENSDNLAMNNYLEKSLSRVDFEPASCNGIACDMQFPIEISFN